MIALYAHKWHYLDNYEPLIRQLETRGIDFEIILISPRNDSYYKHKEKYGDKLIELYYQNKWARFFLPAALYTNISSKYIKGCIF